MFQYSRCAPVSSFRQDCLWDSIGEEKSSRWWVRSIKIWNSCRTSAFPEVSSIFTLSRQLWSEVDGRSGAGIRNGQISSLGQDVGLANQAFIVFCWFFLIAGNYLNFLISPNSQISSCIQTKTEKKPQIIGLNCQNWFALGTLWRGKCDEDMHHPEFVMGISIMQLESGLPSLKYL